MNLLDRVRETIRRSSLLTAQTRVVAAVSGGSDSVALAHLLRHLDRAGECQFAGLAHFNHQLRETAQRDEGFCAELAASLQVPLLVDRGNVRELARTHARSIEDAARSARHEFLGRARLQLNADVVALGHTRDDQAETFLLRLLRGAGSRGLGAMHPKRGHLVRPLLDCRRSELQAYLAERGIAFVHDESNDDVSVPRNRVRAELLPLLQERFNPAIVDVLAEEADLARAEYEWLQAAAAERFAGIVTSEGGVRTVNLRALAACPTVLQRMVVQQAMSEAAHGRTVRFADVDRALGVALSDAPPFDGPGQRVERHGGALVLRGRPGGAAGRPRVDQPANLFRYSLSIPGEVHVPEAGCVVSAEVKARFEPDGVSGRDGVALVRLDKSNGALSVRNRRPGDRFRPLGLGGRKKLQDFFVDRKVARDHRDAVPIVVDDRDRIVWVAGHAIDEDFRVTDPAQAVLILRLKGVGGSF
jgi:tRNA(Ile)-lysidine synthase